MNVRTVGEGEAEHVIMYCVHGNEPCGRYAVERLLHEDLDIQKPVKLLLANEKAVKREVTHVDEDLNRAWNTDKRETHEQKLADKIQDEIKGKKVLDLHSSFSHPEAFGLKTRDTKWAKNQLNKLGLKQTANIGPVYDKKIEDVNRIAVECGYTRSQQAIKNAYKYTKNFLKSKNIISGETEKSKTDKYKIYDKVEGKDYQFIKKNFQKVEKGETYAIKGKEKLKAKEDFYPVMMSTTGYEDMIGFKAELT